MSKDVRTNLSNRNNDIKVLKDYCSKLRFLFQKPHLAITKKQSEKIIDKAFKYAVRFYDSYGKMSRESMHKLKEKIAMELANECGLRDKCGNILFYLQFCDFVVSDLLDNGSTASTEKMLDGLYLAKKGVLEKRS